MAKKIGFGIVGLGMIADFHTRAIGDLEDCEFVAGFDAIPGRADSFCKEKGGKAYSSLDDFLKDPAIDIVTIATPSGLHLDGAVAAVKARKHVIVEKPLEVTKARCDEIIKAADAAGVRLGTIFPSRYFDSSREIKKAVASGRLGTIALADAQIKWYRSQEYYDSGKWRGTWQFDGGGACMNQGIHAIDLLQWFMGDVKEIIAQTATLAHERIEVEDTAGAVLRFANGAIGVIEATTCSYPGFLKRIEICGSTGSIVLEEDDITCWQFEKELPEDAEIRKLYGKKESQVTGGASNPSSIDYRNHYRLFKGFVDALRNDTPFDIDGKEGRKAVEIIEGIYRSAKAGRPVKLPL